MSMLQTVMQAKRYDIFACQREESLCQAARILNEEHISALVVTDEDGYMVGLISQADLLRARLEHQEWDQLPVSDYMTQQVISVPPQSTLLEVAKILLDNRIHRVVVAQEEHSQAGKKLRPLSVISAADLVYHMVRE